MKDFTFLLIIISAFLHALHSLYVKNSSDKLLFIALSFWGAWCIMGIFLPVFVSDFELKIHFLFTIILNSLLFTCFQIFVAKGYERGEISVIYPLSMTGPALLIIWAAVFLKEEITLSGVAGVLLVVTGAIMISGILTNNILSDRLFSGIKTNILNRESWYGTGVIFGLAAAFFNSIGSTFEKYHVERIDPYLFIWILIGFMTLWLTLLNLRKKRNEILLFAVKNWKNISAASLIFALSLPMYRYALQFCQVSIAVPVRRSSLLFGVFFGIIFLKEKLTKTKLTATLLIVSGIWLLNMKIQ